MACKNCERINAVKTVNGYAVGQQGFFNGTEDAYCIYTQINYAVSFQYFCLVYIHEKSQIGPVSNICRGAPLDLGSH